MLAISQPTYLPWIGYFSLIDASDEFVFLDDVQFDTRSWQQRNRILINGNEKYLTLPVIKKGLSNQTISSAQIKNKKIFNEHLLNIKHAYSKAKFFEMYFKKLENIFSKCNEFKKLSEINIYLIKEISKIIGLNCNFYKASDLNCLGKKSKKLINICKKLNKKDYVINQGAKEYIEKDVNEFTNNEIKLFIIDNYEIKYNQLAEVFYDKLSIVDVLLNYGPETKSLVKNSYNISIFNK